MHNIFAFQKDEKVDPGDSNPKDEPFPGRNTKISIIESSLDYGRNPETEDNQCWKRMKTTQSEAEFIADVRKELSFLEGDLEFDEVGSYTPCSMKGKWNWQEDLTQTNGGAQKLPQEYDKSQAKDGHGIKKILLDNGWCTCIHSEDQSQQVV